MTESPPLLLIGAGGHARTIIDIVEQSGSYRIAGLINQPEQADHALLGYPVIGCDDDIPDLLTRYAHAFIGIGQIGLPGARLKLYELLRAQGAILPVLHAPSSTVSRHACLGPGTLVGQGAIVQAAAQVGANVILNSRALIEHDAQVGDHCHIATGAIVNGGTRIGPGSFIGSGAILREGINLGAGCFVGAGALVIRDYPPGSIVKRTS